MQPNQLEQIYRLSDKGLSQQKIADHLGLAKSTVWHHLQKRGDSNQVQRWIVLPDPHVKPAGFTGGHDRRANAAILQYIADHDWDGWLCLGDLNDFDAVSHWTKTKIRKVAGKTVRKQYDATNIYLWQHRKALGPGPRMVCLEGNHDQWIERYIDEHPAMEGMLEVANNINLEIGLEWIPFWSTGQVFRLGHATFIHGEKISKYHAALTVQSYRTNVFYGHTHDVQCYSHEAKGSESTIVGQSLGCLQEYSPEYMRGRADKWQQAFGVFHFMPDGHFWYSVVRIFGGRFVSPEGKVYRG